MNGFRWTCSSMNSFDEHVLWWTLYMQIRLNTYVYVRWVLVGIYMSGESSWEYTCLCPVIPCWSINVSWFLYANTTFIYPVTPMSHDFGESSLERLCPVSPPWNIYVRWVLLGTYMSGESSLEYICPVSHLLRGILSIYYIQSIEIYA